MNSAMKLFPPLGRSTCRVTLLLAFAAPVYAQGPARYSDPFEIYAGGVESRLAAQHLSRSSFLATSLGHEKARLSLGSVVLERLTPARLTEFAGALLEDWRGTAF